MTPELRLIRYFVTVAEEGSFTRAATQRLFVTQPALSKQIRQLESRLRAELFTRSPRAVTLTAAGEALLPRARQLLAGWEEALTAVTAAPSIDDSSTRLIALPMVVPKPRSKGCA